LKKFQIDSTISADIKSAADDSFRSNIKMIEIDKLKPSLDNFFSLKEIELLADDIERQGLKHNIVVTEDTDNPGTYFIKSGHRRYTAISKLIEENRYNSKYVPCFVDGQKTQSENLLDLVMLNATTRVMTDEELYQQYDVLRSTIDKLKAEGKKVKGRFRDVVAKYMNVSPAQVGKIENIKHNAIDEVKEAVSSGKISITVANNIARLDDENQKELISKNDISKITNKDVAATKQKQNKKKILKANSQKEKILKVLNQSCTSITETENIDDIRFCIAEMNRNIETIMEEDDNG